jgi:predicted TIM-barrel fold metal-dependent hydrolase
MEQLKIIDCHAHVFPDKIARKAVEHLIDYYRMPWSGDGTLAQLLASADEAGIYRLVVFSTATKAEQVESINNYIAGLGDERLIGFGTLHPDYANYKSEIQRMLSLGLRGIKLHPDFQAFPIDDARMFPIYEEIGSELPVLFHLGDEHSDNSSPKRLARVLELFPEMTVIAAHLGGYTRWDDAEKYLIGKNLYLDTSSTLCKLTPERAGALIEAHGADKILFGTDYPARLHKEELENFLKIPLSGGARQKILSTNAIKLFNL